MTLPILKGLLLVHQENVKSGESRKIIRNELPFTLPNIMVQGGAIAHAGRPPPLNPSELFTGQFFPPKPAVPDSKQPRFPFQEIGFALGHSR